MRNTPYPRSTIGHRGHDIFDLNKTPGLIQGIRGLFEAKKVKVSDLAKFDHLPPGEIKTFAEDQRVEIVDFGGYHDRGGFVSELKTQVIDLEADSKLTGPMAWRVVEKSEQIDTGNQAANVSTLEACFTLGFLAVLLGGTAFFSIGLAAAAVVAFAFLVVTVALFDVFERGRKRNIERLGSVYVLGPTSRTWAHG
jgi:hypothetical protein